MGFKLPGKSITSGTSAHSSALKMVAEQKAASALKKTYKEAYEEKSDKGEATRKKYKTQAEFETAAEKWWASEAGQKRAKADSKFAHRIKKDTTEGKETGGGETGGETGGKTGGETGGETGAGTGEKTAETKKYTIEKVTGSAGDDDAIITSGKNQNASKITDTEGQSNVDVAKSEVRGAKSKLKTAKKKKRIETLEGKQKEAKSEGKTRRSKRLARKIERKKSRLDDDKSTNITRADQRRKRRADKKAVKAADKKARSKEVVNQTKEDLKNLNNKRKNNIGEDDLKVTGGDVSV